MQSLLDTTAYPIRHLATGETLLVQGQPGGDLFILHEGQLVVERDGAPIATIATPAALIGEMALILDKPNSATVRAGAPSTVHIIADARQQLGRDPELLFRLTYLMASRLDATSAALADLMRQHAGQPEHGMLNRILSALHRPVDEAHYSQVTRSDMFGRPGSGLRE